jgi:phosphopantothenoylcysteine synthetase/decarboxylase
MAMNADENMKASSNKQVSITLSKPLSERLAFVRKITKNQSDLQQQISNAIEAVVAVNEQRANVQKDDWQSAKTCPSCSYGVLRLRRPRDTSKQPFMGCSSYPKCRHTEEI